jgi:hypothetical protein
MPRRKYAKLVEQEIARHIPQLEALGSSVQRAEYLADLMAGEGLEVPTAVLVTYNHLHDDGLRVYTHLLKREQEFEGNIGDLLESLVNYLPR